MARYLIGCQTSTWDTPKFLGRDREGNLSFNAPREEHIAMTNSEPIIRLLEEYVNTRPNPESVCTDSRFYLIDLNKESRHPGRTRNLTPRFDKVKFEVGGSFE